MGFLKDISNAIGHTAQLEFGQAVGSLGNAVGIKSGSSGSSASNADKAKAQVMKEYMRELWRSGVNAAQAAAQAAQYINTAEGKAKVSEVLAQLNAGNSEEGKGVESVLAGVKQTAQNIVGNALSGAGSGFLGSVTTKAGNFVKDLTSKITSGLGGNASQLLDETLSDWFKRNWWKVIIFGLLPLGFVIWGAISLAKSKVKNAKKKNRGF